MRNVLVKLTSLRAFRHLSSENRDSPPNPPGSAGRRTSSPLLNTISGCIRALLCGAFNISRQFVWANNLQCSESFTLVSGLTNAQGECYSDDKIAAHIFFSPFSVVLDVQDWWLFSYVPGKRVYLFLIHIVWCQEGTFKRLWSLALKWGGKRLNITVILSFFGVTLNMVDYFLNYYYY